VDRTAVILQARLGSRRLPGKVLAQLGSRSVLEHCVIRLTRSGLPIIVATTDRAEDDAVEREARRLGTQVFRGDEQDVLGRFLAAAHAFDLTRIIRATADNPLVDSDGPRRVLELGRRVQADHVVECGLPVGTAVEAVTVDALRRAKTLITDPYDREHVTSFVRRDHRFRALRAVAPGDVRRPGLRLTVDTQEDLDFLRSVFVIMGVRDQVPPLSAIIRAAEGLLIRAVASARTQQGA
jgi:spore coat polysaccharide biosynthesis protein SpsF